MDTEMITLEIDGQSVSVPAGTTILEAAKTAGIEIPNLCYLKELGPYGACGVCVVEVKDCPKMLRACSAKVAPGMVVYTKSEKALATRKLALELLMGDHDGDCQGPCKLMIGVSGALLWKFTNLSVFSYAVLVCTLPAAPIYNCLVFNHSPFFDYMANALVGIAPLLYALVIYFTFLISRKRALRTVLS